MRFKLLQGMHQQSGPNGENVTYLARDPARNIVESDQDLERLHGSLKFQNIDRLVGAGDNSALLKRIKELEQQVKALTNGQPVEETGVHEEDIDLESMKVAELREYAKARGIALEAGMTKDDIVFTIQSHLDAE